MKVQYLPGSMKYLATTQLTPHSTVAVIGLGYVGLPTALSLRASGSRVVGVDIDAARLDAIRNRMIDTSSIEDDLAVIDQDFTLTCDPDAVVDADAVIIAVPTPTDGSRRPDPRALMAACASVAERARRGQTIILVSTSSIGTTRSLLAEPLAERGLEPGVDLHVAFSPERLNPGSTTAGQRSIPRVVGGMTERCGHAASEVLQNVSGSIHRVSSPEAAEMCKLLENSFRAVNIALANEFADAARSHDLDVREVIDAASSKPYGFMAFVPGPGVGGHCIPCDPHYLLDSIHDRHQSAPVMEQAMLMIDARPAKVVARAIERLRDEGVDPRTARVLLVGLAYKSGVADTRESPSVMIATLLRRRGVQIAGLDPLVAHRVVDGDGRIIPTVRPEAIGDVDLAVVLTPPDGASRRAIDSVAQVIDATYSLPKRDGLVTL